MLILIWWILLIVSYVIYPLIMKFLAQNELLTKYSFFEKNDHLPFVQIVMAIHNEEKVLHQKLESIFNSQYPLEKFHVVIGLDNCTDSSLDIVKRFQQQYPENIQFQSTERLGKPEMLNLLMRENKKTSDITILTDANVMFKAGTLYELVKYFKDSQVGLVDSKFVLSSQIISHEEEKDYLNFEQQLKYYEGLVWGTMQGPFGACYAIRTSLFHPIPEKFLVDDFFIGMNVMIQGFHAILNPNALVMEEVHTNWKQEFKRKMRISSGNYQNLDFFAKVLFKPFTGLSITWFFHKVLRLLLPVAFLPILVIDLIAFLFWGYSLIPSLITLILILGVVFLHYILQRLNLHSRTIERLSYFIYINLALVQGFIFFIKGIQTNVWKPTQRK